MFAFGLFATDIFVNAGQVVTGNLAPYFLTVCKPNYTGNDCRAHHQFINNGNICTGDMEVIEKARRSFPSKHAALSIYSALYATVGASDDCWLVWEVSACASRWGIFLTMDFWRKRGLFWVQLFSFISRGRSPSLSMLPILAEANEMLIAFWGTACGGMRS